MTRPIDRWKRATAGAPSRLLKPKYRKPYVARGPEGVAAINSLADACEAWEEACKCGFVLCSERGPCAPVVAAPKPSPAPVVERPRFKVGDRVRVTGDTRKLEFDEIIIGRDAVIVGLPDGVGEGHEREAYEVQAHVAESSFASATTWWVHPDDIEPLTAERGAQESDGWTPPAPWTQPTPDRDPSHWVCFKPLHCSVFHLGGKWHVVGASPYFGDYPPTLAQACSAALGIELECDGGLWLAFYQGNAFGTGAVSDPESCARAAVEAWSAMQREGA